MSEEDIGITASHEALREAWARCAEATERAALLEKEMQTLRQEAQHSIRNILSVVRSIARQSVTSAQSIEEYQDHLDGRIGAFARVQAAIGRSPGRGVDFASLLADELISFGVRLDSQATIEGDPVRLRDKPAGLIGLAVHELIINSFTFGALAAGAPLHVSWMREAGDDEPDLRIDWTEHGVMPGFDGRQQKRGFGSRVLQEAIAYELAGSTLFDLADGRFACRIRLPGSCLIG